MILPALAERMDLTVVVDQPEFELDADLPVIQIAEYQARRDHFDRVICQIGNNLHHEFVYREAWERPSVAVFHDAILHHLIVEMTAARGDGEGYIQALRENHGAPGEAWARGILAGLHLEQGKFIFPASGALANRSRHVIVHNRWAEALLREQGVTVPISVVEHPLIRNGGGAGLRQGTREQLGYGATDTVVGMFGFVTGAKRPEVVFEAFAGAFHEDPRLRLLVVGQPSPNVDLNQLALSAGISSDVWQSTGYVSDEEFDQYLAAADRVVNLRYPSAGETSGALLRILAAGKPVAVSDYAQFALLPPIVTRIPFGEDEIPAVRSFLLSDERPDPSALEAWLEEHTSLDLAVEGYVRALEVPPERTAPCSVVSALPLFLRVRVLGVSRTREEGAERVSIEIRNEGPTGLRAVGYGELEYLMMARILQRDGGTLLRRLHLDRDLGPGERTSLRFDLEDGAGPRTIELFDAVDDLPALDSVPLYRGTL